ncbi:MAG: hypothetical protein EBR01_02025 [Proteobacteria bacterium]|nr:hypothetical protein [Pseudomonadota bacterium]NBY20504.1 hypothetical protein [bacterium]
MKKFLFVVSFVALSQLSLAEEASSAHSTSTQPAATSATTNTQKPVVTEQKSKLFDYVSACLAGREIPAAASVSSEVSK